MIFYATFDHPFYLFFLKKDIKYFVMICFMT
jgi:hypothetical protein